MFVRWLLDNLHKKGFYKYLFYLNEKKTTLFSLGEWVKNPVDVYVAYTVLIHSIQYNIHIYAFKKVILYLFKEIFRVSESTTVKTKMLLESNLSSILDYSIIQYLSKKLAPAGGQEYPPICKRCNHPGLGRCWIRVIF